MRPVHYLALVDRSLIVLVQSATPVSSRWPAATHQSIMGRIDVGESECSTHELAVNGDIELTSADPHEEATVVTDHTTEGALTSSTP